LNSIVQKQESQPIPKEEKTEEYNMKQFIFVSIPKQMQPHTKLLIQGLKDVITWNEKGEISHKGGPTVEGSNMIYLIRNTVRPSSLKNVSSSSIGINKFLVGMRDANIPHSWLRNKSYNSRMQTALSTPAIKDSDYFTFSTPGKRPPTSKRKRRRKLQWEEY